MIKFKNSVTIKRPLPDVFAFVSNFENMPKWNYYVTEVDKLTDGPVGEGTTYHQIRKTDEQDIQVVEFEHNRLVAIKTLPPERSLQMRFQLEPIDGGTRLTDEWKLETGVPGPFAWFAARKVKLAVSENLRKLKALLEMGHVTLQNGREVNYR